MKIRAIILAGGVGSRLKPFTQNMPKSLFKLGKDETILERMVNIIKRNAEAEIYVVTGFQHEKIENLLSGASFIYNPFYRVTNSVVSLWFAREYLDRDVIIINADVVIEEALFRQLLKIGSSATVLMDSSRRYDADYKVATHNDTVVMMSKELRTCSGEYAGITKLSKNSAIRLRRKIETMIENEQIDEWYENALVNMVLNDGFVLNFYDIAQFEWIEVDTADDFLAAKKIYQMGRVKSE
jgi:choline kinase